MVGDDGSPKWTKVAEEAPVAPQHLLRNWVLGDYGYINLSSLRQIYVDKYACCVRANLFNINAADILIKQFETKEEAHLWLAKVMGEKK